MRRSLGLDFLRGIAILLVLLFHFQEIIPFGWIGVDLFFVLSGYLISNILFNEFKNKSNVNIIRFLIRRGFKIYPLFFIFILITLLCKSIIGENIELKLLVYELTFTRNYFGGFWAHTWSVCVEEHFYILFSLFIYFTCNKLKIIEKSNRINMFLILGVLVCIISRIISLELENHLGTNHFYNSWARYSHTHHRIDSLIFGVLISYNLNFNKETFLSMFNKYRFLLLFSSVILILMVALWFKIDAFKTTISFVFLYLAFAFVLIYTLTKEVSFTNVNNPIMKNVINSVALLGFNSYAIYLFHPLIRDFLIAHTSIKDVGIIWQFLIYFSSSLAIGYFFTSYIESYFLRIRNKYY